MIVLIQKYRNHFRLTTNFLVEITLSSTINDQLNYCSDMVADFWYSAWVDAGKPNLKHLYKYTRQNRKVLKRELKAYKKNDLLKDSLLHAHTE